MPIPALLIAMIVLSGSFHASLQASSLKQSAQVEKSIINNAQISQVVVDKSAEEMVQLQKEVDALNAEISNLEVYEGHLAALVESQNTELSGLYLQLNEITETRQSVIPLMYEMLDGLAVHIDNDMPIREQARKLRLNNLTALMTESGVSDAEKYRRILEAYQIELDYVNKLGTYTGLLNIDGAKRQVELLYLGHVSFIARSIDAQHYWVWKQSKNEWVALDEDNNSALNEAYLVANKTTIPSLLMLPLSLQQETK
ncbi:DUF3450 domain-containing protein [Psychromonas sp.]|nr:DUF3450 domain-containing protein [Psychromonas sp.]